MIPSGQVRRVSMALARAEFPPDPITDADERDEPALTPEDYREAGLSERASQADLQRKYFGEAADDPEHADPRKQNLMASVRQPIRAIRVLVTQSDLEQVDALCERYGYEREQVAQALLRWAIHRKREWGGPGE